MLLLAGCGQGITERATLTSPEKNPPRIAAPDKSNEDDSADPPPIAFEDIAETVGVTSFIHSTATSGRTSIS
jgi:hypothetical protein